MDEKTSQKHFKFWRLFTACITHTPTKLARVDSSALRPLLTETFSDAMVHSWPGPNAAGTFGCVRRLPFLGSIPWVNVIEVMCVDTLRRNSQQIMMFDKRQTAHGAAAHAFGCCVMRQTIYRLCNAISKCQKMWWTVWRGRFDTRSIVKSTLQRSWFWPLNTR